MIDNGSPQTPQSPSSMPEKMTLPKPITCKTCGKTFEPFVSYGYVCPRSDCTVQPKAR